jgi:hypothetical protein
MIHFLAILIVEKYLPIQVNEFSYALFYYQSLVMDE